MWAWEEKKEGKMGDGWRAGRDKMGGRIKGKVEIDRCGDDDG